MFMYLTMPLFCTVSGLLFGIVPLFNRSGTYLLALFCPFVAIIWNMLAGLLLGKHIDSVPYFIRVFLSGQEARRALGVFFIRRLKR